MKLSIGQKKELGGMHAFLVTRLRQMLRHIFCLLVMVSGLLLTAEIYAQVKTVKPEKRGMDPVGHSRVDAVIEDAIRAGETSSWAMTLSSAANW